MTNPEFWYIFSNKMCQLYVKVDLIKNKYTEKIKLASVLLQILTKIFQLYLEHV